MTDAVNFRDLTILVELFIVSEQVMTDMIVCENIHLILGVGD